MMTFEKVVLDESPALHAKPGNFQRKLTRMTLKATCEPTTPSFIAHKLSKNFVSFLVLLLFSWFCCVTFCLMGLSFWNKLGWMVWVWWGLNLFYSLETNDRALVSSYFGLVFYFEYYMQTLFVCLDVLLK